MIGHGPAATAALADIDRGQAGARRTIPSIAHWRSDGAVASRSGRGKLPMVDRPAREQAARSGSLFRAGSVRRLAQDALAADDQLALLDGDLDGLAFLDTAFEDQRRQRVLQAALDHPLERPGAIDRIVAAVGQPLHRPAVEVESDLATGQELAQLSELDVDDVRHVSPAQPVEQQDLVEPVEKLRPEGAAYLLHHLLAHRVGRLAL